MALKLQPRPPSSAKRKQNGYYWQEKQQSNITHDQQQQQQHQQQNNNISYAPLFYHISPGSTGSRTLYHASCTAGFPSIHHKSFCISQTRGIRGVATNVAQGVRSHYEILRLYEMAADCCSLWSRGRMRLVDDNGGESVCNMPLHEWTRDVQTHLTVVIQSGLVGLFDTPYPYLAPQVLELADKWRKMPPIIAMTERDPKGWANSRSKNHGMLVCREEYSYEKLGASEFDVIGCVDRAYNTTSSSTMLHFWDVFQYRSHNEATDVAFQLGMERQMEHHQSLYLPMARYTPDIFGMHSSSMNNETTNKPINEKDVVVDVRSHILGSRGSKRGEDGDAIMHKKNDNSSTETLQSIWQQSYTKSLSCRGRVDWEMKNDTFIEYYHLPKTCGVVSSKAGKGERIDKSDIPTIPLIPVFYP
ncbi:hypothetical protein ACHAXR_013271 [Thalassiosira sp. AJA248-18]